MKIISWIFTAVIVLTGLLFESCGKYDEGPAFSLSSKKHRLTHEIWTIEKVLKDGVDDTYNYTQVYKNYQLQFRKDGTYRIWATMYDQQGTWKFDDNEEYLLINPGAATESDLYKITCLKSGKLWITKLSENREFHYEN